MTGSRLSRPSPSCSSCLLLSLRLTLTFLPPPSLPCRLFYPQLFTVSLPVSNRVLPPPPNTAPPPLSPPRQVLLFLFRLPSQHPKTSPPPGREASPHFLFLQGEIFFSFFFLLYSSFALVESVYLLEFLPAVTLHPTPATVGAQHFSGSFLRGPAFCLRVVMSVFHPLCRRRRLALCFQTLRPSCLIKTLEDLARMLTL